MTRLGSTAGILFVVISIGLAAGFAGAYQIDPRSLTEIADKSVAVVRGKIVMGEEVEVRDANGSVVSCGQDYKIRVEANLRGAHGAGATVQFRSADRLRVGTEYLVFLSRVDVGGELKFVAMGRRRPDLLAKCQESGPEFFASLFHGELMEFDNIAWAETGDGWVRLYQVETEIPKSVAMKKTMVSGSMEHAYHLLNWNDLESALRSE